MEQVPRIFWQRMIDETVREKSIRLSKDRYTGGVPRPRDSGLFRRSVGELKGQVADWRATVPGTDHCVHAVEYRDRYELHLDLYDPRKKPLEHLLYDSPKYAAIVATGAAATMAIVRSFLRKK
ncbi:MAG: hypothetical protein ACYCSO_07065 [Cuniculiplasma sp.]